MMPLKSLLTLWVRIASTFSCTHPMSLTRIQRVTSMDHLTITLPKMGKVLDASLSSGYLQSFKGVASTYKGTKYPVFLREYFQLIFDKQGYVRDDCDPTIIRQLRTLLYLFYKYECDFTPRQLEDACEKFVSTDQEVKVEFSNDQISNLKPFFRSLLDCIDPLDIRGSHSNGATACRYDNIQRREIVRVIPSLMGVYGYEYFFQSHAHLLDYKDRYGDMIICEPHSRVAFVPKDSRGPRTICMEPHERMFIQHGLMEKLYFNIESHPLTRGRVNFTDQDINARLALSSSLDRRYATIDLKDASDLVSNSLVQSIVPSHWADALRACRTATALLPDDTTVTLRKFAPMGSAVCFPIEALVFYAICRLVCDDVYVYGDDLIIPTEHAKDCMDLLETYGLKVNREKSYIDGYFRESCGIDAYRGGIVTPVRFRQDDYTSVVAFANNIAAAFGEDVGEAVLIWYESFNQIIIPRISAQSVSEIQDVFYTTRLGNSFLYPRRWNVDLQRWELKLLQSSTIPKRVAPDSWEILRDALSSAGDPTCFREWRFDLQVTTPLNTPSRERFTLTKEKRKFSWVPVDLNL